MTTDSTYSESNYTCDSLVQSTSHLEMISCIMQYTYQQPMRRDQQNLFLIYSRKLIVFQDIHSQHSAVYSFLLASVFCPRSFQPVGCFVVSFSNQHKQPTSFVIEHASTAWFMVWLTSHPQGSDVTRPHQHVCKVAQPCHDGRATSASLVTRSGVARWIQATRYCG